MSFQTADLIVNMLPMAPGGGVNKAEVESIVMDVLIALGIAPVLLDENGAILTDDNGNILITE